MNKTFKLELVREHLNQIDFHLWLFVKDDYNSHDATLLHDIIRLHLLLLFSVRDFKGFDLNN